MGPAPYPRVLPCGDAAVSVEFGEAIDPALNARVLALDAALAAAAWPAVLEAVPTYRSLLVHYDPGVEGHASLAARLLDLAGTVGGVPVAGRAWRVPVVYGGEFGVDLEAVAAARGLSPDEVVARHAAPAYRVYMLGFSPGFAYLGGLDPALASPRRAEPRPTTPAGTISIGGAQAAVQGFAGPSGWHLLGRTPVRNYHPGRAPMVLIAPGDTVRFVPTPAREWDRLDARARAGEAIAEVEP